MMGLCSVTISWESRWH